MDDLETLMTLVAEMPGVMYVELKYFPPHWTCAARVNDNPPEFVRYTKDCPLEAVYLVLVEVSPLYQPA